MVDLPAPDGDDRTSINPRRAIVVFIFEGDEVFGVEGAGLMVVSLQILNLFAELVDHDFQFQSCCRYSSGVGFGTDRIRLPVKFLCKKIELAPDRTASGEKFTRR